MKKGIIIAIVVLVCVVCAVCFMNKGGNETENTVVETPIPESVTMNTLDATSAQDLSDIITRVYLF